MENVPSPFSSHLKGTRTFSIAFSAFLLSTLVRPSGLVCKQLQETIINVTLYCINPFSPNSAKSKIDNFLQNYKLGKIEKQTAPQ